MAAGMGVGGQSMLQAVGVGARRSLPAAAGLTWVLKDGLGRLGRLSYTSLRGRTFDCHLKVWVDPKINHL